MPMLFWLIYTVHFSLLHLNQEYVKSLLARVVWGQSLQKFGINFFEKVSFEKNQQITKSMQNYPACEELRHNKSERL